MADLPRKQIEEKITPLGQSISELEIESSPIAESDKTLIEEQSKLTFSDAYVVGLKSSLWVWLPLCGAAYAFVTANESHMFVAIIAFVTGYFTLYLLGMAALASAIGAILRTQFKFPYRNVDITSLRRSPDETATFCDRYGLLPVLASILPIAVWGTLFVLSFVTW